MGSKTSKTEQENKPPAWAEGLFKTSAADAQRLYDSGVGGQTYTGSTVSDLSDTTMQGVNQLAQAGQGWDTAGTRPLFGELGGSAVNNPFMAQLQQAAGGLNGITSGATKIGTEGDYRNIYNRAQQPTSAQTNLSGYASGDYLKGEGNPFYRRRLEREIGDSNALIQSQFSGAGRYGSGANQSTIADNTSNMLLGGLEDDFNRQTTNQFNAVNAIDSSKQAALGTQMGAVQGMTGVQGQNIANRLQGAGTQGSMLSNAGGMYSTGIGQATTAADRMAGLDQQNFTNRLTGAGATLQAGGILDQQAQKQLSDEVAKWYAQDNEDWTRLGMLQTAAAGAAGPYGSQVATTRQPMDVGSILGGIGSLFGGKSDARLKEDIKPLGWNNGFPVYEFSYKGRPGRFIGVMAQDLLIMLPEAVIEEDDGFYAVDYRKIGFPLTRIH